MKNKQMIFKLEMDLYERVRSQAFRRRTSMSELCRKSLSCFLENIDD
ncbi:hypothetical protein HOE37_06295 [Candidatus Woesearchaeota archaeon]|nr:hypothetical protein [Candidatus Woesearchaeota archaeon]MBT4111441.1 hypothetical protein [Candidatus Woesearchaeota archaeon]MBT4336370.1 hypothetical protein [Candidatus Woesearchaeota archaeon]MBT4469975.1 hypothetical protein [Candidatus Woesearchaeota archaeon]MBT6744301.1 hypothetical protein [Candidatus Woesearchaeota archaeon]